MKTIKELTKLSNGEGLNIEYPIRRYDQEWNQVYYENSYGYWEKRKYKDGKEVYYECSNGSWYNCEYDEEGNEVYFRDSDGLIIDNREPVDMTMAEIIKKLGRNIRIVE